MNPALGLLETTGLTPAMVAIDTLLKNATVRVLQVELNDFYGVCVKLTGPIADVRIALDIGHRIAEQMGGRPVSSLLSQPAAAAQPGLHSRNEFNALIQQDVVFDTESPTETPGTARNIAKRSSMNQKNPPALGFIETQGFTAVFEAIDTACKAADVQVVGKEKLGGGYVTVVLQGDLSAVTAAVEAGKQKVGSLGTLIAAHVVARPAEAVLKLLPQL